MKALIVIELPDEHILRATNDLYDRLKGYKCSLIPMPQKYEGTKMAYEIGWNDCIEEIEHESTRRTV